MGRLYILWIKIVLSVYFLLDELWWFGAGAVVVVIRRAGALGTFGRKSGREGKEAGGEGSEGIGGKWSLWPVWEAGPSRGRGKAKRA